MSTRVAFVTSGAKGLGYAMVYSLVKAGWNVAFTYGQSEEAAKQLVNRVGDINGQACAIACDLFDREDVERALLQAKATFGRVDAVIHNFGPFIFERVPLRAYDEAMWQQMIQGNLTNFFWLYSHVIDDMRTRRFGRFITVGYEGASSARGWGNRAAYAAAKAGLASLTRSVAVEERLSGITANMVCPGDVRGEDKMKTLDEVRDLVSEEGLRPAVGEDIARTVTWLCQEDSQEVNGTVIEVTGGREIMARDVFEKNKR